MNADDDSGSIETTRLANLNNDRAKAEGLFRTAIQKKPKEFWHWVNAGGSTSASSRSSAPCAF